MSASNIQVPPWALPLIVSVFVGAVSYGAATAEGQATAKEVERVGKIATTVQAEAQKNGKQIALNQQAIQQIADGLKAQQKLAESSDAKLGKLIEIMLEKD